MQCCLVYVMSLWILTTFMFSEMSNMTNNDDVEWMSDSMATPSHPSSPTFFPWSVPFMCITISIIIIILNYYLNFSQSLEIILIWKIYNFRACTFFFWLKWSSRMSSVTFNRILFLESSIHPSTEWILSTTGSLTFYVGGCKQQANHHFGYLMMFTLTIMTMALWAPRERRKAVTANGMKWSINGNVDSGISSRRKDNTWCCDRHKHNAGLVQRTRGRLKDTQQLFKDVIQPADGVRKGVRCHFGHTTRTRTDSKTTLQADA